jgi:hypothetical protein
VLAALAATQAAGCVKRLPAVTPSVAAPAVDTSAPLPPGHGRLVIDVVDLPAPVARVVPTAEPVVGGDGLTRHVFTELPTELCPATPCVVDLPRGNVLLGFPALGSGGLDVELVHVGPEPSVYRRSLSIYEDRSGATRVLGIIATSIGGVAMMTGIPLLSVGAGTDRAGLATAGGITLGAGTLLVVLGIIAMNKDAPTFRPGASVHFPLAAP